MGENPETERTRLLWLSDCSHIESLINLFLVRTKNCRDLDVKRTIDLLNALDRVRLELKYRGSNKND